MKQIELRLAAASEGRTTYEGTECSKCGGTLRHVSSGGCVACAKVRGKASAEKTRDRLREAREAKQ